MKSKPPPEETPAGKRFHAKLTAGMKPVPGPRLNLRESNAEADFCAFIAARGSSQARLYRMMEQMQTSTHRRAVDKLFASTAKQLGEAALAAAKSKNKHRPTKNR